MSVRERERRRERERGTVKTNNSVSIQNSNLYYISESKALLTGNN